MAVSVAIENRINIFGTIYVKSTTVSHDGFVGRELSLAAALSGTLSTRTDNTDGTLTVTDNTITTGQSIDLYWDGGKRVGVTVGTVSGDDCPISGGSGDNLPAADTEITTMVVSSESLDITDTGDVVTVVGYTDATKATIRFMTSSTLVAQLNIEGSTGTFIWDSSFGTDNPLDGETTITDVLMSHGDSGGTRTVSTTVMLD